ncbi:hypothetical protein APT98_02285 [Klebsiella quasipneumoniae]|nr:hypothetical protein APT98_02285 [Klebsiella quasipneumoniae]
MAIMILLLSLQHLQYELPVPPHLPRGVHHLDSDLYQHDPQAFLIVNFREDRDVQDQGKQQEMQFQ